MTTHRIFFKLQKKLPYVEPADDVGVIEISVSPEFLALMQRVHPTRSAAYILAQIVGPVEHASGLREIHRDEYERKIES